ncbi:MAG TPA: pentapeptide repeat-containing protein [Longimicrobium sp.]|nr:pentapeptide repeat-containing protein [Longimicrobium sp.]
MAERKHGAKAPATTRTVSGADWYGQDISGQTHEKILFVDLDLTEVENTGAVFNECTFRRAKFNVSTHKDAAFVNCTFAGCTFYNTRFTECKFLGSMFDRCTYDVMKVEGGNWSFVGMPGADLRNASFRGTRLREADLTGVRLQGTTVRDADLGGASLHGADLRGCDLRGSDLSGLEPENVQLRGAIITIDQTITIAEALGLEVRAE